MQVVTATEMARIEGLAYADGAEEELFMETAGKGVAEKIKDHFDQTGKGPVVFLCGKGNNSGDAYVAATLLLKNEFDVVVYQLVPIEESSPLCQKNYTRYEKSQGVVKQIYNKNNPKINFPEKSLIIDGLFGTGFRGAAKGIFASVIQQAN